MAESRTPKTTRPRKKHTVRNVLIGLAALLIAMLIFVFGINKWRIEFSLIGDDTVTYECGTP